MPAAPEGIMNICVMPTGTKFTFTTAPIFIISFSELNRKLN